jgi:hypothetical protein
VLPPLTFAHSSAACAAAVNSRAKQSRAKNNLGDLHKAGTDALVAGGRGDYTLLLRIVQERQGRGAGD